ncbi:MAG: cation diffusion facilitator family transporter [Verrucomicrobiales bacterium]|jgi:cation diffusion facilitator family transporter
MAAGGSQRAVITALFANLGIAIAKFVGFLITGASSMLAESIHSVADTTNQGLLLLGGKRAVKDANDTFHFGYGRERYFWSFVVALLLFSVGAGYALYEGILKILDPHEISNLPVAIGILLFAIALEAYAFSTAVREANKTRRNRTWWQFVRTTRNPELPVVLLEDSGAMLGLVVAIGGISLSEITGNAIWDGIATFIIGVILAAIAVMLAVEMKSLLIGESADPYTTKKITEALGKESSIVRVIELKTQHLGPEDLLIVARVKFDEKLGGDELASAIDGVHARLKQAIPMADFVYIEPELHSGSPALEAETDSH